MGATVRKYTMTCVLIFNSAVDADGGKLSAVATVVIIRAAPIAKHKRMDHLAHANFFVYVDNRLKLFVITLTRCQVNSQDVGIYDVGGVHGSSGGYAPSSDMSYYSHNYYQQPHAFSAPHQSRMPRYHASNIYYNPHAVTMMPDTPGRSTEAILDGFPYSTAGPLSYNSCYQAGIYSQADNNQYYTPSHGFQQRATVENDVFRYPTVPLSQLHSSHGQDAHSSFSTMDTLARSLPGPGATQRTLPVPPGKANASDMSHMGQYQQQQQQPVLKSQGIGSYGPYSNTNAILPPTAVHAGILNETSSPDLSDTHPIGPGSSHVHAQSQTQSQPHAQPQQRLSLRSNASNAFSNFSFPSSASSTSDTAGGQLQHQQPTNAEIDLNSGLTAAGEHDYTGYRSSFALDPAISQGGSTDRSGSSSNTSSVQYTLASSNSSKRGSQGSLFTATYEDVGRDVVRKGSVASLASGGAKKWDYSEGK